MAGLVLRKVLFNNQEVLFFRDRVSACDHMRDHLLSAPESEVWSLLFYYQNNAHIKPIENMTNRFLKDMYDSNGCSSQALYDEYSFHIGRCLLNASQLKWLVVLPDLTVAMGLSGIICIIERSVLKTAFIGGAGNSFLVNNKKIKPYIRYRHNNQAMPTSVISKKEILHDIYLNFKKSIKFVRSLHVRSVNIEGHIVISDYARLKEVLPPLAELKFDAWQNDWLKLEREI